MSDFDLSTDDTVALQQLLARYAHLVDDGDFERLSEIFAVDVVFDATDFGRPCVTGLDAVIQSYVDARHPVAHHVTNPLVVADRDGTVRMRSKVIALLEGGRCGSGTYDDVCVKAADGWRIARRTITLRQERDLPRPPPRPVT
jgi:3-phenylpropionate/cinnamic acid dioxygenase small subunit